jgi:ParB family chromosome partitioning protein
MNHMSINQEALAARPRMASVAVPVAIPLARLVASAANVRKTGAKDGIGELAASIAAHGLRQNLNVRPTDTERFEVVAGGRRLRALRMLVKQKRLPKDVTVPCIVMDGGEDAAEVSLVENTVRTAMHPDDQFMAFAALVDGGMPVEDVAARFGVAPALVERRLRLAKVSPRLRGLFRKGELTLDHIMAFTVTDDHVEQERVWQELPEWRRGPDDIRAALTREAVRFDTPAARFVGVEAYVAAGGTVMRDLFDEGCEGFAQDRVLLLALAGDRLQALAEAVQAEGWKWVKAEAERDYSVSYRRVFAESQGEGGAEVFAAEDMAKAGAIVRIGRDGSAQVERGLIHPDDIRREAMPETEAKGAAKTDKGALPASLVEDLTAHRTAALRLELARNPAVALAATVHALAGPLLYGPGRCVSALEVRVSSTMLESRVAVPDDCAAHAGMQQQAQRWHGLVPEDEHLFFGWCLGQPQEVLLDLLAFAAGSTVNAVRGRQDRRDSQRLAHADALATAVGLDMAAHWQPSITGFYGRLSKAQLLAIVTEAKAPMAVSISTVKKAEAARYVAEAMVSTQWLPTPLRAPEPAAGQDAAEAA